MKKPQPATAEKLLLARPPGCSRHLTINQTNLTLSIQAALRSRLSAGLMYSLMTTTLIASGATSANTININSKCSLVEAIQSANQDRSISGCQAGKGADRLVLPTQQHIYSNAHQNNNALPAITSNITIEGNGASIIRKNNSPNFRFFYIDHAAKLTLKYLTLKGGKQGPGGAVFVQYGGQLIIQDSILTENTSLNGKGGAIESRGDLVITRSLLNHNSAGFSGGGIHITEGSLNLDSSTISHNLTNGVEGGAGITIQGQFESKIVNSTISSNSATAGSGGGIRIHTSYPGEVDIISTTIAANSAAKSGAGISHSGDLTLSHSIISGNQAPIAAEIAATGYIVANAYNVFGHSGDAGISGLTLFGGDIVPDQTVKEIIGPLSNNGGKTPTHALVLNSPAINAGGSGYPLPSIDQRGVPRPQGGRVDIGSIEAVAIPQPTAIESTHSIFVDGINCSLHDAITAALTDQQTGGCSAGIGSKDTIQLQAASVYEISHRLPEIISNQDSDGGHRITIEGNGSIITADPAQPPLEFFSVSGTSAPESHTPVLTLKNLSVSGAEKSAMSVFKGQIKLHNTSISHSGIGIVVDQDADLFVNASTISDNKLGGITANANALLVISNSTISSNGWPGIMVGNLAQLKMTDSTVTANGGRGIVLNSRYLQPEMSRNLISGNGRKLGKNKNREIIQNTMALQWKGGFNLLGYDGISGSSSSTLAITDIVPEQPLDQILMPLERNGGLTKTHALATGSPAIDVAGIDCATLDQRGISRPQEDQCDIGSYELSN